ncbi:MAG: phosphate ABC transporter permease PstA [Chloroflexi bacterium]|nr:phosphate ABC transporter permease PstA [Chloroflexota bacterium]
MAAGIDGNYNQRLAHRKRRASLFYGVCVAAVILALLMLVALLYSVISEAVAWLNLDGTSIKTLLTEIPSSKAVNSGLFPAIVGTLWVMGICVFVSFTVGVSAAIYLEEYSGGSRLAELIQINIQNLAAVPSIVYGILGLSIFVVLFSMGKSTLAAGLTLALLIMPVVIVSSQEAIKAVPSSIREGGFALGGTRWQVIQRLVLPQAMPGILTGIILAVSRAMGEAAPLVIMGALSFVPFAPASPLDRFTVLPIQIYVWISKPQEEFHHLAAAGIVVLLIMLLGMNAFAIILRNRLQKNLRG